MCFFAVCLCQSLKFCVYLCLLLLKIWHSISISFLLIICIIFNEAFTYNVFDTTYKRVTCSSTLSGHPSSSLRFWSAKQSSSIGMQIELSLQSRAHFANFIFQKCCHPSGFCDFGGQIELSPLSCALFLGNFRRSRPAHAETETFLRRPHEPVDYTLKITGFRARQCFHPWIHAFPNCHSSLLFAPIREVLLLTMLYWHDDDDVMTTRSFRTNRPLIPAILYILKLELHFQVYWCTHTVVPSALI